MWDLGAAATQLAMLGLAFVLSAVVGLEREYHLKDAGLRTHVLVGVGAALFTVVSGYGFAGVQGEPPSDPARIAAQVVTGIGFIGAGVVFTRRSTVHGLTTAATIWLVAALGVACGAELPVPAIAVTLAYVVLVPLLGALGRRIPVAEHRRTVLVRYRDGAGVLRAVLSALAEAGYAVSMESSSVDGEGAARVAEVRLRLRGRLPAEDVVAELAALDGVRHVDADADRVVRE